VVYYLTHRRLARALVCGERRLKGMMKTGRKTVLIVVVLAVILSIAAIIAMNIPKEPEKAALKIMSDRVDLQVRNIRYTDVGDSGMKWEIMAETARYQKKENLAFFEKVTIKLVTKDGRTFLMTGDRGKLNTESRDMEIEGNVNIVSDNRDRLKTDHLRYLNAEKLFEAEGSVVMENRRIRVSGVGMTLSLEEKKIVLLSQVRANYTVERKKGE
jgi:LPS export ABC transporter protein LptC